MILIDAGPLVALCSRNDTWHLACHEVLAELREPLLTVWPAITEAMHLIKDSDIAQETVLEWLSNGAVKLAPLDRADLPRIGELMRKYRDLPMDLADAALVRVAERERIRRIFTVDRRDFEIYRPYRLGRFQILP
ncbi:MAG TPA: PIN domain-containing protein [Candidatus Binataceae bacterium]|nr:PIN domain-containing protein [Candidatus Binataceae bacterium]